MSNYAWVLEVRPGYEDEYKKRHDEIWPEMVQMLSDAGLRNYNIRIRKVNIATTNIFKLFLLNIYYAIIN